MTDLQTKKRKKMIKRMAGREEMNFIQALLIIVGTVVAFIVMLNLLQRAVDIEALQTCEQNNNCSEIIREINNR